MVCRPATAQPFVCVFRGSSQPPLPGLSVFIRGFPAVTSRSRSAGGPPAPGVLRPETVGGAEAFGSPFSDHFARRPKRSRSWLGRGERAGRPRSDGMVTAQCQRLFPSSRAGSTPGGGCAPHSAAAFGLEKISTERHFLLAFGSAKKSAAHHSNGKVRNIPKFSPPRPSRTRTGAVPPFRPRAVAPAKTVSQPPSAPLRPRGSSSPPSSRPSRPRRPLRTPYSPRCALASRRRGHIRADMPWRTVFAPISAPLRPRERSWTPPAHRCAPKNRRFHPIFAVIALKTNPLHPT